MPVASEADFYSFRAKVTRSSPRGSYATNVDARPRSHHYPLSALYNPAMIETTISRHPQRYSSPRSQFDIDESYSMIMDPDCAICSQPAVAQCDCEAKGLDVAVRQAEQRMMTSFFSQIRYLLFAPVSSFC